MHNPPPPDEILLISPSARSRLPLLMAIGLILCLYLVLGLAGLISASLVAFGSVVFGLALLGGLVDALRVRNKPWELRLDPSGVTVRGHQLVPWTDLTELRVTGLRPRWLFWFSLGCRVLSFIGGPGTALPTLPSNSLKGFDRRSWIARERLYGSQLIVMPYAMDVSAAAVIEGVQRWSDVPIR